MAYTKQTWQDLPSKTTPINASRLGHIEQGIYDAASTADTAASNASSAISGLADKVDKVDGKGLSTNDFTDTLKTKLDGIATGAEVNVQSDWNQSDNSADDYIKNKPTLGTSAYKNSTSVVTDSTDLVESGAVYDALLEKADNSVIGTVEGVNASKAWSVGKHFIKDGQFKEVTSPIASGEDINSGNTTDKPIAELLDYSSESGTFTYNNVSCNYTVRRFGRIRELAIAMTNVSLLTNAHTLFNLSNTSDRPSESKTFAAMGRSTGAWAEATYYPLILRFNSNGNIEFFGNSDVSNIKYLALSVTYLI